MKPIIREEIRSTYPEILTIENIRCILGFSKRKVSWMLQNGVIKCKNSGKKSCHRKRLPIILLYGSKFL